MAIADIEDPGNFAIVIGDDRVKARLRRAESDIDDWLYELVDKTAFLAAERLRTHAPGSIHELVDVDLAHELEPGAFEATAGVTPSTRDRDVGRGRGSNSADFPIFVDQGTGIYGERGSPITATPGNVMGPIMFGGRDIYIRSFRGQPAQHFSERAYEETAGILPLRIGQALPDLERKIDS